MSREATACDGNVAIVGAGPAGLMAAEVLLAAGETVDLYERMPSVARKLLMAGKGGLNITHSEAPNRFVTRYGAARVHLEPLLREFGSDALRRWAEGLGVGTFVGTSGRVFPHEMKAAPLLRTWMHRLRTAGARVHVRHRWLGWTHDGCLRFETPTAEAIVRPKCVVLAVGGGSWPQLGSDGAWTRLLGERGVALAPLKPSNCGFNVQWSSHFKARYAGHPVNGIAARFTDVRGELQHASGEMVATEYGVEGGVVYALSSGLRDTIAEHGSASLLLDLQPNRTMDELATQLARPRGSRSISNHLRSSAGIHGVKSGLLHEVLPASTLRDPAQLAAGIKALPLTLASPRPIEEAISTAGGVSFASLDEHLMLRSIPGVFCAGEMLDWEAPTGGYLLTACFATGRAAGLRAAAWIRSKALS